MCSGGCNNEQFIQSADALLSTRITHSRTRYDRSTETECTLAWRLLIHCKHAIPEHIQRRPGSVVGQYTYMYMELYEL